MKRKFTFQKIFLLLLALIITYRFSYLAAEKGEKNSQVSFVDDKDGFLNYVLLRPWIDGPDDRAYWHINKHFDSFKELNFNASNMYAGEDTTLGFFAQDFLNPWQEDSLESIFRESNQNGLRCVLGRGRIELLCRTQRLIYEVEDGNNHLGTNYGFVYRNNMTGVFEYDGNRTVLAPKAGIHSAGLLCDSIYENLQHTDLYYFHYGTDTTLWKIKPVMKIDSSDFSTDDTTAVVAIITKNYSGITIDSIVIRVNNFAQNNYTGKYDTTYFGLDLSVLGKDTINGLGHGRPAPGAPIDSCKIDFKVYWFGLVDVWFDKMIVDDDKADRLYSGVYDIKIQNEVDILKDSVIYFVGEITSSQAYTTKYVKDKIYEYNQNAKLQFAVSNNINLYSHRNPNTRARMLLDIVKPEMMCLDDHVFQMDAGYQIYLPNNLSTNDYDSRIPDTWKASPQTYNTRLQTNALGNKYDIVTPYQGTFIYQIINYRNDLRELSVNTKFVVQPHLHSWTKTIRENNIGVFADDNAAFREPTNEEIQVQAAIAIAHGVQSLNWECYHSENSNNLNYYQPESALRDTFYTILGLRNDDGNHTKRTSNIIGQDKWNYVKAMNLKILHWKPTLDAIKWQSGYSVHSENANHEFISDIKSIRRNPSLEYDEDYPFTYYDASNERYWEMGFFDPDFGNPSVSPNDKSKYFLMVNRRCVPDTPVSGQGDFRGLRIKFDSPKLAGFTNWKIIELDNNNVVATFDKTTTAFINMGEFKPGEGKLYKLVPVMQEGGTLVADEEASGSFDCNGEVNNNGKNITLKAGSTIYFSNINARIKMNGGNFKSGYSIGDNSAPVNLKGKDGNFWKGLLLQNCSRVEILRTYFENVSPYRLDSTYALDMINCEFVNVSGSSFKSDNANNTGGIRGSYSVNNDRDFNTYISNNQFLLDAGNIPAVSIISTGGLVFPIIMEYNNFNSQNGNSLNAIFLNNISGGAIKNNNITGYKNSVIMLSSSLDFYGNIIDGSYDNSIGIQAFSESNVGLGNNGNYYLAGLNEISSEGANAKCVFVEKSYFDIYKA